MVIDSKHNLTYREVINLNLDLLTFSASSKEITCSCNNCIRTKAQLVCKEEIHKLLDTIDRLEKEKK